MPKIAWLLLLLVQMLPLGVCNADRDTANMTSIENDQIRLGANLEIGGAITHLSTRTGPNMINSFDWGRQIQMSFYSHPVPFEPNGKKPRKAWASIGWNPIQSGDCYDNGSTVLEHRNDGKEIYVKCRPMHWPLNNQPAQCIFECWYSIDGNLVKVRSRITNSRDDRTRYPARVQELPAIYTNGPWYKLVSYKGERPFTQDKTTILVDKNDGKGWPWRNFYTPEHWVALLDEKNCGLGVYLPNVCSFTGGFAGTAKGLGGPKDSPTGYMSPTIPEVLDHNINYTYDYTLIVGSLKEIRDYVYKCERDRCLPKWEFKVDRQSWTYANITDSGWPVKNGLNFKLGSKDAFLISPKTFWRPEDAPMLYLNASFKTSAKSAQLLLQPYDALDAGDWAQWGPARTKRPKPSPPIVVDFPINGDGQVRNYKIDLSKNPKYSGSITEIKLRLPPGAGNATIHAISIGAN